MPRGWGWYAGSLWPAAWSCSAASCAWPCPRYGGADCPTRPEPGRAGPRRKGKVVFFMRTVPIWEKANLTLEEAAAYYGIGINRLRSLTDTDRCPYVLWVGNKRLEKYLEKPVFRVTVVELGGSDVV